MEENQKSYIEIFKATSIFGSVQILNIIASLIRSKFAAILIGSVGIGVLGVLNSTIKLISGISKVGLDTSSIKEIAFAKKSKDQTRIDEITNTLRRILWIIGIIGMLSTIALSSVLSEITFGNEEYTIAFMWLSIAILFNQLTVGSLSILQGLRRLRLLASANLMASFTSVIVVVPFYYYLQLDGIVPSIIVTSIITFFISLFYLKSIKLSRNKQTLRETFDKGKTMIKLGAVLSISGLISLLVAYLMQIYITNKGGLTQVGLYNAAIVIINSYVGLVFNAMSKDYFPRLSETINNRVSIIQNVNRQSLIAILLLTPIVVVFLSCAPFIIRLIYSKEFLPIVTLVSLGLLGTLFKAMSWSQGYVIIAKGDSEVFIKTTIGFNFILLTFNIIGYNYYGLMGLGVSFASYNVIHYVVISIIMRWRYSISLNKEVLILFFKCMMLSITVYICTFIELIWVKYWTLIILVISSIWFSMSELHKKINVITLFKEKRNND